jgi:hypothetical protein
MLLMPDCRWPYLRVASASEDNKGVFSGEERTASTGRWLHEEVLYGCFEKRSVHLS